MKDFMAANKVSYTTFVRDTDPHDYGEDKDSGIAWDNGIASEYDDKDDLIGTYR